MLSGFLDTVRPIPRSQEPPPRSAGNPVGHDCLLCKTVSAPCRGVRVSYSLIVTPAASSAGPKARSVHLCRVSCTKSASLLTVRELTAMLASVACEDRESFCLLHCGSPRWRAVRDRYRCPSLFGDHCRLEAV